MTREVIMSIIERLEEELESLTREQNMVMELIQTMPVNFDPSRAHQMMIDINKRIMKVKQNIAEEQTFISKSKVAPPPKPETATEIEMMARAQSGILRDRLAQAEAQIRAQQAMAHAQAQTHPEWRMDTLSVVESISVRVLKDKKETERAFYMVKENLARQLAETLMNTLEYEIEENHQKGSLTFRVSLDYRRKR
jgi:hypothetical protein